MAHIAHENIAQTWRSDDVSSIIEEQYLIEESLSWPLAVDAAKSNLMTDFSASSSKLIQQNDVSEEPQPCCSKSLPPLPSDWYESFPEPEPEKKQKRRSERLKLKNEGQEKIDEKKTTKPTKKSNTKEENTQMKSVSLPGFDPLFSSNFKCEFNFGQTLFLYLSEEDDEEEKFLETLNDHVFYSKNSAMIRDEFGLYLSHNEFTNAVNYISAMPWIAFTDVLYQASKFIQWSPFVRLVLLYRCHDNVKKVVVHRTTYTAANRIPAASHWRQPVVPVPPAHARRR